MHSLKTLLPSLCLISAMTTASMSVKSEQLFQQQGQPPQLIELYTSEGCSSCPPADNYLSQFTSKPGLWQQFIPLAFHVDYWDYIGWKDRFAKPEFNKRQYDYRRQGLLRSVYTPGWMVNGREWRGFFSRSSLPDRPQADGGELKARLVGEMLEVLYTPKAAHQQLIAHVALMGFDLSSQVTAGENHGRQLDHQFVVLEKLQKSQLEYNWQFKVERPDSPDRQALAIWITTPQLKPLQATANWLKPE